MMKTGVLVIGAACLLWSCFGDVPHENPLDPDSPLFVSTGVVRGQVTTFYKPYLPISGVSVELWPGSYTAVTDSGGVFVFRNVPIGGYWAVASHRRYASDSTLITVEQENPARIEFKLDALPQIRSFTGRTTHVSNLLPDDDLYFARFEVKVSDPDGLADIAGVILNIPAPSIGLTDTMQATAEAGIYDLELFGSDLPSGKLHSLVGHQILVTAMDRLGHRPVPKEFIISRIIEETSETISPVDRESTGPSPTLVWTSMALSFPFTFRVQVDRIVAGINTPAWEKEAIDSNDTMISVDKALASGEYRWTVSVVDEFGNTSTSKPAAFVVQ